MEFWDRPIADNGFMHEGCMTFDGVTGRSGCGLRIPVANGTQNEKEITCPNCLYLIHRAGVEEALRKIEHGLAMLRQLGIVPA